VADLLIRTGTTEYVAAVVELGCATETLPHWTESQYVAAVAYSDEGVRRCLFVAEIAGELVGFAVGMVAVTAEEVISELESVAVAASARRIGVAKALCGAVIAWARSCGAHEMELEVRSGSAGAIRLYEGLGFVAVGQRLGYYKGPEDDAVLMRARL
jgi:ribosomal-protein-alanine N-acetyltransferase